MFIETKNLSNAKFANKLFGEKSILNWHQKQFTEMKSCSNETFVKVVWDESTKFAFTHEYCPQK